MTTDNPPIAQNREGTVPRPPAQILAGWLDYQRNLEPDPEGITYQRWFTHWTDDSEAAIRLKVEQIIESYSLCMVGADTEQYVAACADDVLAEALGWPVRYHQERATDG